MQRTSEKTRKTKETDITLSLNLDGAGAADISTGVGFFDHMLTALAMHGGLDLRVAAVGDLNVDMHHTVEDVGIVLGLAVKEALGGKAGLARFGHSYVPMDEALAFCCVDVSGRPYLVMDDAALYRTVMDGFDPLLAEEFFRAFALNAGITLHLRVEYGKNPHHMMEALFKSCARALGAAVKAEGTAVKSTKGVL